MPFKALFIGLVGLLLSSYHSFCQQSNSSIQIVGAMKNVMWKGQLYGTLDLDTISNKHHLFGLGPVEFLTGELLIIDGKAYKSSVLTDSTMQVEETFQAKAPFFGYANINSWSEQDLPDHIRTISQLESFLEKITKKSNRPFFFQLKGRIEKAQIHVVNLPKGSTVSSPEEAHQGQTNYFLTNEEVDILGFFSTEHKAIFTHHDTYLHMHLITSDKQKMGHLDDFLFREGTFKLYLPTP
ncbi:acetolactate decarboxylase [Fluviicola taffensis]|uniref:acetolactate decarboxylase n=1 Tax=Fluviicola taffensis TaxID=191579 RepID=UPI003137E9E1